MSERELSSSKLSSNGTYKFNEGYKWLLLIVGTVILLGLLGPVILSTANQEPLSSSLVAIAVLGSVGLIAGMVPTLKRSRLTIEIKDEGIFVHNTQGDEVGGLRWTELAEVTATHKMTQLVLWDSAKNRRVIVDRNFQSFPRIRERILNEYAKVFTVAPLPMEFRRSNFWTGDEIACVGAGAVMGWVSLSISRNNQPGSGVFLFCLFEIAICLHFLSINPQVFGASQLFDDRIELNALFRKKTLYKNEIKAVEIVDFAVGQSGRSAMVLISAVDGRQLKILQRYGSLPAIYLTLRARLSDR